MYRFEIHISSLSKCCGDQILGLELLVPEILEFIRKNPIELKNHKPSQYLNPEVEQWQFH